jgi:hypothetical protein
VGKWAGGRTDGWWWFAQASLHGCDRGTGPKYIAEPGQTLSETWTYLSGSESSVSRLLATLLARPSDSSLWLGGRSCTSCKLSLSSGGPFPLCECEAEGVRLERALNMRDMRVRRAEPEVSLRASSEPRRLFDMREWSASLASERVVEETLGLLERGRSPGVAKDEVRLRRRPMAAMAGEGGGSWVCVAGEPVRVQRGLYGEVE